MSCVMIAAAATAADTARRDTRVERARHDRVGRQVVGRHREDGLSRRQLHRLRDAARARVECAAEHTREREHVVDLVREVAASGGDDGGVPRARRPGAPRGRGWRARRRSPPAPSGRAAPRAACALDRPDEHVGALEGLRDPAADPSRVGVGGKACLLAAHPVPARHEDAARVEHRDVRDAGGEQDAGAGHARRHPPRRRRRAAPPGPGPAPRRRRAARRAARSPCRAGRRA